MDREKVILTPEKLRAAMQAHFRAFVSDVRAVVDEAFERLAVAFGDVDVPRGVG
mgnify:CR=1 FL=1